MVFDNYICDNGHSVAIGRSIDRGSRYDIYHPDYSAPEEYKGPDPCWCGAKRNKV